MNRNRLKLLTKKDEGEKSHIYKCSSGKNTIGIGRNVDDNPIKPHEWEYILGDNKFIIGNQFLIDSLLSGDIGLSKTAINLLFENDIDNCEHLLRVNYSWFEVMTGPRQEMLINFMFQVGYTTFTKFKKMIKYLSDYDFHKAALEFKDSKYWRERKEQHYRKRAERIHKVILNGVY